MFLNARMKMRASAMINVSTGAGGHGPGRSSASKQQGTYQRLAQSRQSWIRLQQQ
jgi:hypothetical protein